MKSNPKKQTQRQDKKRPTEAAANSPIASASATFILALLTTACATLAALSVKIGDTAALPLSQLFPIGCFAVGFPFILLWMKGMKWHGSPALFGAIVLLCGLGLAVQFRMGSFESPSFTTLYAFPIGLIALLFGLTFTMKVKSSPNQWIGWLSYMGAIGLLGVMVLLGNRFRGGVFLPGNMNPSEIAKPLLIFFLASFFERNADAFSKTVWGLPLPTSRPWILFGICWAVPMALTLLLHDLGFMIQLNAVLILMLFAIAQRKGFLVIGLSGITALALLVQKCSAHAAARFHVWADPFSDPTGKGWQILQALSAMYSGGLWGAGLGSGIPQSIPIVTSDFVYAAMAEEIGLVGCLLLFLTYLTLFSQGFRVSGAASTLFEKLLGAGVTSALAVQTFLNIGGVTKALPMTGIPLPFISQGGSSLVTSLFMAGILLGLSHNTTR